MRFTYQARTKEGKIQTGTVEAGSYKAGVEALQRHDLTVVLLEGDSSIPFYARSLKIFQKVKIKELVMFYRQLAILSEVNTSLLDSLKAITEQLTNPYFKDILFEVETDVRGGEALSSALAKHKKVFSPFYINVIQSGEATGRLSEVLKYLADHAEKEFVLRAKIKGAFTYPGFIFSAFVLVAGLMMVFVVPKLTIVLVESGQKLPLMTRGLIGASDILRSWSWLIVLIIVILGVAFVRFKKTKRGEEAWDKFKLKIPVLGDLSRKIYITRFSENFSTLLKGGLPILSALKISSQVIGNVVFSDLIKKAAGEVKTGKTISSVFEKSDDIPALVVQMLKVGEKSAKLDTILERLAIFYQGEVDRLVNNLTQLIEPFMILILGGGVAFLVAAILMPIYNLSGGF